MLLGSSVERSKANEMLAAKGSVAPVSVTESNEIPHLKVEETANTTTTSAAELKPVSPPNKNDISHAVVDDGINTSKPEDVSTISKSIGGISTKAPAIKAESTSAALAAPKQREIISHWDNLEPLLEGLEESQKRAVRQERARRIDEQTRMFAARKLCLVLDLDHTLLNSAKVVYR
jgi:RNA polymerase II C-terminal domain phosphatase-like 3/4